MMGAPLSPLNQGIISGKRLSIFVSSTTLDMERYRRLVADAITRLGQIPITMETMGASSLDAVKLSLERVGEADVLVGLLGYRYGSITAGRTLSVTEMEYHEAVRLGKLILMYVPHPTHHPTLPPAIDEAARQRQDAFISKVHADGYTYGAYSDADALPSIVTADLSRVISGGAPGVIALRKGQRELQNGNYTNALTDLGWAVQLLPHDGFAPFLLALAMLNGRRPQIIQSMDEIRRVEELVQVAQRLAPGRVVLAFWGALKLDYYVAHGFTNPHRSEAQQLWADAVRYPKDPILFDLVFRLQPELALSYLQRFR